MSRLATSIPGSAPAWMTCWTLLADPAVWAEPSPELEDRIVAAISDVGAAGPPASPGIAGPTAAAAPAAAATPAGRSPSAGGAPSWPSSVWPRPWPR